MADILSGHLASFAGAGGNGDDEDNRRAMKKLKNQCQGDPPLGSGLSKPKSRKKRSSDAVDDVMSPPCAHCGKVFWSLKALYGHMRLHPDRPWRGMNPPDDESQALKKEKEVAASLMLLSGEDDQSPVFWCKSCKKSFESRQALGGHRASHKNVKGCCALERDEEERRVASIAAAAAALVNQWVLAGEALAKRKRMEEEKKPVLDLDLNFPAPDEESDGGHENDDQKK